MQANLGDLLLNVFELKQAEMMLIQVRSVVAMQRSLCSLHFNVVFLFFPAMSDATICVHASV